MSLVDFAQSIWDGFCQLFYACFTWVLNGVVLCIGYPIYYIFKGFLTIVGGALSVVDLSSYLVTISSELVGMHPALRYLLAECGISTGLTIILGAIGTRMLLNLLPAAVTRI